MKAPLHSNAVRDRARTCEYGPRCITRARRAQRSPAPTASIAYTRWGTWDTVEVEGTVATPLCARQWAVLFEQHTPTDSRQWSCVMLYPTFKSSWAGTCGKTLTKADMEAMVVTRAFRKVNFSSKAQLEAEVELALEGDKMVVRAVHSKRLPLAAYVFPLCVVSRFGPPPPPPPPLPEPAVQTEDAIPPVTNTLPTSTADVVFPCDVDFQWPSSELPRRGWAQDQRRWSSWKHLRRQRNLLRKNG